MTKREFYEAIVKAEVNEEIKEFAKEAIAKLDAANEKRRNATSKKAAENAPLNERILNEILGHEPKTAADVAAVLEVTVQKASSLLVGLAKAEKIKSEDVKIPKKGKQKGYSLIAED